MAMCYHTDVDVDVDVCVYVLLYSSTMSDERRWTFIGGRTALSHIHITHVEYYFKSKKTHVHV